MKLLTDLPDDLVRLIWEYVPVIKRVFTHKKIYEQHHDIIRQAIPRYEPYVLDMIQRDCYIVFERILGENIDNWMRRVQYRYKNMAFNNYIYFIVHYCSEHKSQHCKEMVHDYLQKRHLCRNLHKKNVVKYIKWTNYD